MSDPTGKASRQARSRAACIGCRQTKQRCDGPTRIPCRRCELYGILCEYGSSAGPVASKPAASFKGIPPAPVAYAANEAVAGDRHQEILDRLKAMEAQLAMLSMGSSSSPPHTRVPSLHDHTSISSTSLTHDASSPSASELSTIEPSADAKSAVPLSTVTETLDLLDQISFKSDQQSPLSAQEPTCGVSSLGQAESSPSPSSAAAKKYRFAPRPDVLERGILSIQECEASLAIFNAKMGPWIGIDPAQGMDALTLRAKCPILFHAIVLSTAYYLTGTERGRQVYYALTALTNELIAPVIISPQPRMINSDLIRAFSIIMLWKPIQHAMFADMGVESEDQMERLAKLSQVSAASLLAATTRTAFAVSLPNITDTFAKTFSPSAAMPPQVVADLRLFYWLSVIDTHRQLTVGVPGEVDPRAALKSTRLLAALKLLPTDVRLAATVEVYAIVKDHFHLLDITKPNPLGIRKFNNQLDEHRQYWQDQLRQAGKDGDPLFYYPIIVLSNFVRLIVNSTVFTRWRYDRKAALARGDTRRPQLSHADWESIGHVVTSAEAILFSTAVDARQPDGTAEGPLRKVDWPTYAKGNARPAMLVDGQVAEMHRTSFDTVMTVTYPYTAIILCKMANSGLITCELNLLYDQDGIDNEPRRLVNGAKLGALISLTADFMTTSSPTATHPSRTNARMLRMILAAGTMGQSVPVDPRQHVSELASEIQRQLQESGVSSPRTKAQSAAQCVNGAMLGEEEIADAVALNHLQPLPSVAPVDGQQPGSAVSLSPTDNVAAPPAAGLGFGDAGEMLASVLAGLSPSYFGGEDFFNSQHQTSRPFGGPSVAAPATQTLGSGLAGGAALDYGEAMQGVAVDWDSLEKSLQLQQSTAQQQVVLPDFGAGITGWESFWAQGGQATA